MSRSVYLHDERSDPPLRQILGSLLTRASHADMAVGHVRLLALDLSPAEVGRLARCRMLLGRLDAAMLDGVGLDGGRLGQLGGLLESGLVEVRSSSAVTWTPDFSVFRGLPAAPPFPNGVACLLGAHYFAQPPVTGPSFTCVFTDAALADAMRARFEQEWTAAHDVAEAVTGTIRRLHAGSYG
jgi:hypothetical protein